MEQDIILKKDGVALVRKRLKGILTPLGFRTHPTSKGCFVRIRDEFIDEVSLRTDGYHLEPVFSIFYRPAPFTALCADEGSLWRLAQKDITTQLRWDCEIPDQGGSYYYKPEHFEEVWQDVVYVWENYVFPKMEEMTVTHFLSLLAEPNPYDREFFRPHEIIRFIKPSFMCVHAAAVYGVGMWKQGKYDEGVPYLTFAQYSYRQWIAGHEPEKNHFYQTHVRILDLLDDLVSLWAKKEENWMDTAFMRIRQVTVNWTEYML